MNLRINGEIRTLDSATATLADLLATLPLPGRYAVELNARIVPRSAHATTPLHDGDKIEVVQAIGGG